MKLKKIIMVVLIGVFSVLPTTSMASTLKDLPPAVSVEGINLEDYNINKVIEDDKVIITLQKKDNGLSYSWTFDRSKVGEELTLNFELNFDSPLKEEIELKSQANSDKMYLSFSHHGELPSEATIKVNVSNNYTDGTKLYLYYYNEEKKQIEYIDSELEVVDGYVEFAIDHCSEYFLTATIVNDAANNPKSMNAIILVLVGVIVVLVGATVFSTKK